MNYTSKVKNDVDRIIIFMLSFSDVAEDSVWTQCGLSVDFGGDFGGCFHTVVDVAN